MGVHFDHATSKWRHGRARGFTWATAPLLDVRTNVVSDARKQAPKGQFQFRLGIWGWHGAKMLTRAYPAEPTHHRTVLID